MFKNSCLFFLIFSGLLWITNVQAQESSRIVNRSNTIQIIDGKEYFFHAVLQGQTMYSIARAYGVGVEDIERENPELREHGLRYNQMIRVPVAQDTPSSEPASQQTQREVVKETVYIEHQVKRRETVYGISRMYDISMDDLLKHNPEARRGLRVNMILRIPQIHEKVVNYITYQVPPQQTLFSISREYNVSIEELERLNPELRDGLMADQVIRIPMDGIEEQQPPFVSEPLPRIDDKPVTDPRPIDPYCLNPVFKDQYDVALLIPLYLNRFASANPSTMSPKHPSFTFIDYYEGILIALDSVRAKGADIRLHVFDVCDSLPKTRSVLRKSELARMDLIIGPFHPNSLELAGEFAKTRNIPIISPLYAEDNLLLQRFPNMFQATPSIQTQMNEMAKYISQYYPDENLILVHNNQPGTIRYVNEYKRALNRELNLRKYRRDSVNLAKIDGYFLNEGVYVGERITNVYVIHDSLLQTHHYDRPQMQSAYNNYMQKENLKEVVYNHEALEKLKSKMDADRENIFISLMGGQALISNYIRQLHQLRDTFDINVFAVPQWTNYESLEFRYLQNLNVHIYNSHFVDYNAKNNTDFIRRFRSQNHDEPGDNAFRAVHTGVFFFNALHRYGADFFKCMNFINMNKAASSPFWFQRVGNEESGWENKYVYLYKYEDYNLKKVSDTQKRMAARP